MLVLEEVRVVSTLLIREKKEIFSRDRVTFRVKVKRKIRGSRRER